MNLIVWSITFEWGINIPKSFDFDVIETLSKTWDKNVYLFWETEIESSKDFISMCKKEIWKIKNFDISISSENKIELLPYDYQEEIYEIISFEWEEVEFSEILEKLKDNESIFSVREAEVSEKFLNRIVRADNYLHNWLIYVLNI